jgi:hypothetical protein
MIGKDKLFFPIVSSPNLFRNARKIFEKYKVPTAAIDEIGAVQPYGGGHHPLWQLKLLVNSDKHRLPVLVGGDLRGVTTVIRRLSTSPALPADSSPAASGNEQPVDMHAQLSIFVALQDAAVPREPVERTLENIVKSVADVIPRFDGFLA